MTEELTLDLAPAEGEPKPWIVRIWRYGSAADEPFVSREDAVEYAIMRSEGDDCSVEGPIAPDGTSIEAEVFPWRRSGRTTAVHRDATMTAVTYKGMDLAPRTVEVTIPVSEDTARSLGAYRESSRMVRVHLQHGQRWPDSVKRGSVINLDVNGSHFIGKVRFRRLHRLVIDTYPGNKVPIGDLLGAQRLVAQR